MRRQVLFMKKVFILTYCRKPELLYGTTLIFKTLRAGFPTAEVNVVDNNSVQVVRPVLRDLAEKNGCNYFQLDGPGATSHPMFIRRTVFGETEGTVIFLDPDILLWEDCENWSFNRLMAGRLIPKFRDEFSGCITMSRLHTSFLWIEDVGQLRQRIQTIKSRYFDYNPFSPYVFKSGLDWYRFDTGANLYSSIKEDVFCFGEKELNSYDHLFCGSHIDLVINSLDEKSRENFVWSHGCAADDYKQLKGIWKQQEVFFRKRMVD